MDKILNQIEAFNRKYRKELKLLASILSSLCGCSLVLFPDSMLISVICALSSLFLFLFPVTYIPLIFISSISSSISIFGVSALFFYAFLFLMASLLKKGFNLRIPSKKSGLFLPLFLIWLIFISFSSASGNIYDSFKLIFTIILLVLCACLNAFSWRQALNELDVLAIICSVAFMLKIVFLPCEFVIEGTYSVKVLKTLSDGINPNQLGLAMAILFVLEFSLFSNDLKYIHLIPIICLFVVLLLLMSRNSFFSSVLVSGLSFLSAHKFSWKIKILLTFFVAAVLAFFIGNAFFSDFDESSTSNDAGKTMSFYSLVQSGGSGRLVTWALAFSEIFPENYIKGIGVGIPNYESFEFDRDGDNLYVDLLIETGIPGFLLFFLYYFSLMVRVKRKVLKVCTRGRFFVNLTILILLCGIGETMFDSAILWTVICLCLMFLQPEKKIMLNVI